MQNSKDIQELIYRTIENISKELINKTNYLYLVEGKVTEIDTLGNCYVFKYQDEDYVGFSITGEKYNVGDLIYVLFSHRKKSQLYSDPPEHLLRHFLQSHHLLVDCH